MSDLRVAETPKNILKREQAFVGLGGTCNTVSVVRTPEKITWRLSPWTYALTMIALILFGPGLLALLWFRPPGTADLSRMPIFLAGMLLVIPTLCCALIVHYLFYHPRVEFLRGSGELLFYKRPRTAPCRRLGRHDITGFHIEMEWFRASRGAPVKNFTLFALCADGQKVGLCKTASEKLVQELAAEMKQPLGL